MDIVPPRAYRTRVRLPAMVERNNEVPERDPVVPKGLGVRSWVNKEGRKCFI